MLGCIRPEESAVTQALSVVSQHAVKTGLPGDTAAARTEVWQSIMAMRRQAPELLQAMQDASPKGRWWQRGDTIRGVYELKTAAGAEPMHVTALVVGDTVLLIHITFPDHHVLQFADSLKP